MADPLKPTKIQYHYIKSTDFRVVHADGVYGGPTPKGLMHLAFFSERPAIPTSVEQELISTGENTAKLGTELNRVSRGGVVRELAIMVMMNSDVARALHSWLTDHLAKIDAAERLAETGGDDGG